MKIRQGGVAGCCVVLLGLFGTGCSALFPAAAPAASPTATASRSATRTLSPTPTSTATASTTPTPVPPTPTPTPPLLARVTLKAAVVREGPGTSRRVVAQVRAGDELALRARTPRGDWLEIGTVNGKPQAGWISARVIQLLVPADAIPLPTETPMRGPANTASPLPTATLAAATPSLTPPEPAATTTSAPAATSSLTPAAPPTPAATTTPVPAATPSLTRPPSPTTTPAATAAGGTPTATRAPSGESAAGTWHAEKGGVTVTVHDVQTLRSISYRKARHDARFFAFRIAVANNTDSNVHVDPFDVRLIDRAGTSYVFDSATFVYGAEALSGVDLAPGEQTAGSIAFLLASGAEAAKVTVATGDYFFRNTVEVELGEAGKVD